MVGKIYYQESRGAPFKAYVQRQVTYWLKCKKRTDNKSIIAKPVVIKLMSQSSGCADCGAKKSIFVKEYKSDKKK